MEQDHSFSFEFVLFQGWGMILVDGELSGRRAECSSQATSMHCFSQWALVEKSFS
jgi:hypothetical protein